VFFAPIDHAVDGGNFVRGLDRHCGRSTPVDSAPQVAKLRAASGTRDFFNPAVRFQIVERQPELSSGLFVPEKRDFGAVLSPVDAQGLVQGLFSAGLRAHGSVRRVLEGRRGDVAKATESRARATVEYV
jgi:hypothetical protein